MLGLEMRFDALADNLVDRKLHIDGFNLVEGEEVNATVIQLKNANVFVESEPQMDHVVLRDDGRGDI